MRKSLVGAAALLGAVTLAMSATAEATTARGLSKKPIAERSNWRHYVLDQTNGFVYPKRVAVVGDRSAVSNPQGLERPGGGVTTVTSSVSQHPQLVLDLGMNAGGYVEIGIIANGGATVRLGYSEARRFLTTSGDTGNPNLPAGIPFLTDPSLGNDDDPGDRFDDFSGTGQLRSVVVRGGQRWISLELTTPGTVSIDYVRVREEHLHPSRGDYAGHFLSSDDLLNRIWYAGAYTFALDSFKDLRPGQNTGNVVVTDGAKRDRLAWLGDLAIENMLGDYSLRQAPRVIRETIQLFSCQQGGDGEFPPNSQIALRCPDTPPAPSGPAMDNLPEYTAWWVVAVHDYDRYTGDDRFARRMLPDARRALGYFIANRGSDGLYSTPPDSINWHPFDTAAGEDTHTNAVIYRALRDGADLERRLGAGRAAASAYTRAAASLRAAMLAKLWDPSTGAFVLNASDSMRNHTEDAQVEALLDGVITGRQASSALSFVEQKLSRSYGVANGQLDNDPYMSNYISPYIGSTDLLARLGRNQTGSALALIRREWGHMVNTDPNSTLWEKLAFDGDLASYSPNQAGNGTTTNPDNGPGGRGIVSMAHGWSGGPIPALSGYILGTRPLTAGYRTWIVAPQLGDLKWAQGRAPTPYGALVDRWQRGRGNRSFAMTVIAPHHTKGQVAVPLLGRGRTIARNDKIVWRHGRPARHVHAHRVGDAVVFTQGTGRATYAWIR